jgi:hypothetical protein
MRLRPNPDTTPPRAAERLVSLFVTREETDFILGDLSEEFSRFAIESGIGAARRWYWRQALKSLPHLVWSAFRASPWSTTFAVMAGFLLRRFVARGPDLVTFAVVEKFEIHRHHFTLYRFLASTALDIEHVITFLLVGCVVALLARRREMAAAIALAMIFGAMAVIGSLAFVIRGGDYAYLLRLSWYFTDSLAVVLGAVIVRMLRSNRPIQRQSA